MVQLIFLNLKNKVNKSFRRFNFGVRIIASHHNNNNNNDDNNDNDNNNNLLYVLA